MRVLVSRTTLALIGALSLGVFVSACATGEGTQTEDTGVTPDTGPGDMGLDDIGMPQICESCRDTSNCPEDFECQTIDDGTGQRACLPTCGRDEFDVCPEGWACVGATGAGVCFPARGCCTAQNVGVACEGEGQCGAGIIECDDDGGARCSTEPGGTADQSVAEICNGLDDDCDGEVDEAFLVGDPCDGRGACGAGTVQCDPTDDTDMTTLCSTEPGGTQNQAAANDLLCNGIDDDCDGQTDEDRGVGMICDGAGACGAGELECATINTTRCSTDPGGSPHNPSGMDVCDGADNDCDGFVDETFPTIGNVCAGVGACGAGLIECSGPAATQCSTHPGGSQFTGATSDNTCTV